jgi:RNA polymerase primary sigma factor
MRVTKRSLTQEVERELAMACRAGDEEARRILIESNVGLVVCIAGDFMGAGLEMEDLVSEGTIGLMKAIDNYKPEVGRLGVYARWWILKMIRGALTKNARTVRLPSHIVDKIYAIKKVSARLEAETGGEAGEDEIADETGMTRVQVRKLQAYGQRSVPLDHPDGTAFDPISETKNPAELCAEQDSLGALPSALSALSPRERLVVEARYGINGPPKTLDDLGKELNLTKERIRQIQMEAIKKMKRHMER